MRYRVICAMLLLIAAGGIFYFVQQLDAVTDSLAQTIQYQIDHREGAMDENHMEVPTRNHR
jgi:hypothetical protein